MKNFFLTLIAFPFFSILTACGALVGFDDDKSCDLGNGDETRVWDQVEYLLPECWEVTSTYPDLVLEGLATVVKVSKLPFDGASEAPYTLELPNLETLYLSISPLENSDPDVQRILESMKRYPFSLAASSCEAPDSTYAESINYEWLNLSFALPFCWGAEESLANNEPFKRDTLTLTEGDENFWVKIITEESIYDGTDLSPMREDHEGYSTFNFQGYFYAETNAPDEHDVQLILDSLTLQP